MSLTDPIIYLNGSFLPKSQASISVEDRGTMFGDGVYEMLRYFSGHPLALDQHLERLGHSLAAIKLDRPADVDRLAQISDQVLKLNSMVDASVYWQITRGSAPRDRAFPSATKPTVLVIPTGQRPLDFSSGPASQSIMLTEDIRWARPSIKSLTLLPAVLLYNHARAAGYDDAILYRDQIVTESTSANLFMVRDGQIWTHPADQWILHGITRQIVLQLAEQLDIVAHEQPFTVDELHAADELFLTGTTTMIGAVTAIDGMMIGLGKPGPITTTLHRAVVDFAAKQCSIENL